MKVLLAGVRDFIADENGATAIEYGLIAALMGIGILIAVTAAGGSLTSLYAYVSSRSETEMTRTAIN